MGENKGDEIAVTERPKIGFRLGDRVKAIAREAKGIRMPVLDELGNDTGAGVLVFGSNSAQYRAATNWQRAEMREIGRKLTDDETLHLSCGFLARCCGGMDNFYDETGASIEFSFESLTICIEQFPPLFRQLDNLIVEPKRFLEERTLKP